MITMRDIQQKIFDISVNITCIGVLTKILSCQTIDNDIKEVLENIGNVCAIGGTIAALIQRGDTIKDAFKKVI